MKTRLVRSLGELREASKHVAYEIEQLAFCLYLLRLDVSEQKTSVMWNIELTAFTVFARTLYSFLDLPNPPTAKGKKHTPQLSDLLASDYFFDSSIWQNRNANNDLYEMVGQTNKRSAHLTYTRLEKFEGWEIEKIFGGLSGELMDFIKVVDKDRVDPALYESSKKLNPLLGYLGEVGFTHRD